MMRSRTSGLRLSVWVLAAVAALVWVLDRPDNPAPAAAEVLPDPDPQLEGATVVAVELPEVCYTTYPPGTRMPVRLPEVAAGIPIGGGRFLPPLNRVRVTDGIPAIRRDPRLPELPPVVAKQVDQTGQEWWIHADGSQTSCSYASVTGPDGRERRIVSTQHGAALAGGHGGLAGSK